MLAELGMGESPGLQGDLSLLQHSFALSNASDQDPDSDPEGVMTPERAVQLWAGGHGLKSRLSSSLSSRANSALTLTDSDNEHKTDDESGRREVLLCPGSGVSCCVLVSCAVSWCVLLCPGVSWCVLMCSAVSWCVLLCPGVSWYLLCSAVF